MATEKKKPPPKPAEAPRTTLLHELVATPGQIVSGESDGLLISPFGLKKALPELFAAPDAGPPGPPGRSGSRGLGGDATPDASATDGVYIGTGTQAIFRMRPGWKISVISV